MLSWFRRGGKAGRAVSAEARECFDEVVRVVQLHGEKHQWHSYISWEKTEILKRGKELEPKSRAEVLQLLLDEILPAGKIMGEKMKTNAYAFYRGKENQPLIFRLGQLRRFFQLLDSPAIPFTPEMQLQVLEWMAFVGHQPSPYNDPMSRCVASARSLLADPEWKDRARPHVEAILGYTEGSAVRELRAFATKLGQAMGGKQRLPLTPGEAWSDAALRDFEGMEEDAQDAWLGLLAYAASSSGSKPSAKWTKGLQPLLETIGKEAFRERLLAWFPLIDKPRTRTTGNHPGAREGTMYLSDEHMDVLRGLVWACPLVETRELTRALTALAVSCYKKIPGLGPRATRVGNACIYALGQMHSLDAVGQMALLKVKMKFGTAQKELEKALAVSAEALGLPREDLEEMSVPAYGLDRVGAMDMPLGTFTAELRIADIHTVDVTWRKADGNEQKSLPASVKSEFVEELKELKLAKGDIEKMLPAQAERLDSLFLRRISWPLETWIERYLDHPLVGTLARRLIWNFETSGTVTPGIWLNGKLVDRLSRPIPLEPSTTVRLWHPLNQPGEVVLGWRAWLEEWEIRQPFKQAHREIYLLTPAEESTRVYSNRFAAHILKQHQFNALCAVRGWKNKLRLMVDDTYPPATRHLPEWGLRAEFWVEGLGSDFAHDTNEAGVFLYLGTDQVRFYRAGDAQVQGHASGGGYGPGWGRGEMAEPLALAEIPPLVFSEIMRDVDLFVGVTSVGNDPAWADGGRSETLRAYWHDYAFGALSVSAENRRDFLQKLVPKLKIAPQCSFLDKFLVVQGKKHTYKIHLGSGNILRSPDDRYLCIVASQGVGKAGDGKVFLPFDGDRVLSVILSKAFLLAEDHKITDPTILRQL